MLFVVMTREKVFQRYIQIADLLGQMFPNVLEVVVHDFSDLDRAIIHIVNGVVSGRTKGEAVSELNMLTNYTSRSFRGQQVKSSSLAIRDDEGRLIGAFCLHFDMSQFEQFQKFLDFFINSKVHSLVGINDFGEKLAVDEEIKHEIDGWLLQRGRFATQLTYKEKQLLVGHLYKKGHFNKKGAVPMVANALQLTRQSIYNYIELVKG
jgi:predicted transcriptional regulator YheO